MVDLIVKVGWVKYVTLTVRPVLIECANLPLAHFFGACAKKKNPSMLIVAR